MISRNTIGKIVFAVTCCACAAFMVHVMDRKTKVVAQPPPCVFTSPVGPNMFPNEGGIGGYCYQGVGTPEDLILASGQLKCGGGMTTCGQYSVWVEVWGSANGGGTWLQPEQSPACVISGEVMNCGGSDDWVACIDPHTYGFTTLWDWEFYVAILKTPCSSGFDASKIIFYGGPITYSGGLTGSGWGPPVP